MDDQPPQDYESLNSLIAARHQTLSKRLKQVADFALDHPTTMGIETIAHIALNANVQNSVLIRFAKAFGYKGFSDMQRIFQRYITEQSESYKERVKREISENGHNEPNSFQELLTQYCEANIVSIEHLQRGISARGLIESIQLLKAAQHIYIIGQRRSLPVATYLTYTLSHAECRTHLIDGSGGLLLEQSQAMREGDLLIAISFHPYSADTTKIFTAAADKKIPCIAITDSSASPIVRNANVAFSVHDAEVHNFRSLSAALILAQTLATGLAFELTSESSE